MAVAATSAAVPGLGKNVSLTVYQGDASGLVWDMVTGHWYTGPGQAVVNTADPAAASLSAGETIHLIAAGKIRLSP